MNNRFKKKLKILFISRRFYPEIIGGGQISAYYIAKEISKYYDVNVCTFADEKNKENLNEIIDNIKIKRYFMPKFFLSKKLSNLDYMYYQIAKKSSEIIKEIKPDIIHLLNFESIPYTAKFIKKNFDIPIITTVNGPNFGCFIGTGNDYKNNICIKCETKKRFFCSKNYWGTIKGSFYYIYSLWYMELLKESYKYIDKFIGISNAMVPLLKNMCVDEKKISVIHNPIGEIPKIDNQKIKEIKKKYLGKKILLCASRLAYEKGIQFAIEAMKYLDDPFVLLIIGSGSYESELKRLTKKLNLEKKVFFIGKIEQKELYNYYKISFLFLHFPYFYEPFGRTLIEAMSMGCPCLAYPVAGIKDIVNEKNGFLLSTREPSIIAKKIKEIEKNKKEYKKIRYKCILEIKKYSDEKIAEKYIKEYSRLIKKEINKNEI
ncbi:MAG: glycosyltransferase family 4 protein [Candidatus Woesearchaeota archaeon]